MSRTTRSRLSEGGNYTATETDVDPSDEDPLLNNTEAANSHEKRNFNMGESNKKSGPFGVMKSTQFSHLIDPTGKGVSQQAIIIDNIKKGAADILNAHKGTQNSNVKSPSS